MCGVSVKGETVAHGLSFAPECRASVLVWLVPKIPAKRGTYRLTHSLLSGRRCSAAYDPQFSCLELIPVAWQPWRAFQALRLKAIV